MPPLFPDALLACIYEDRAPRPAEIDSLVRRIDADVYGTARRPLSPVWHGRTRADLAAMVRSAMSGGTPAA